MSSRRGQFYMIDAFFAAFILFVGMGLVVSNSISSPTETQTQQLSADITSLMVGGELADVINSVTIDTNPPNAYSPTANTNTDYTLSPAQQAAQWIETRCNLDPETSDPIILPDDPACLNAVQDAEVLSAEILGLVLSDTQSGVLIEISDDSGNTYEIYREATPPSPQTKQIVRRQVYYTPQVGGGLVGPLTLEVRVWQ